VILLPGCREMPVSSAYHQPHWWEVERGERLRDGIGLEGHPGARLR
jgi:hypothetical protein